MEIFKSKIPNLKTLNLVGGEPLLHKQIIDLCKTARNILPNIIINAALLCLILIKQPSILMINNGGNTNEIQAN